MDQFKIVPNQADVSDILDAQIKLKQRPYVVPNLILDHHLQVSRAQQHDYVRKGGGVFSSLTKAANRLTKFLPASDANAADGWDDEKHAILKLPNGRFGRANFMGPGTHIVERLERGDRPRTAMDELSEAHDIRYTEAATQSDVARADEIFIRGAKKILEDGLDNAFNVHIGLKPIQAKLFLEAKGLMKPLATLTNLRTPLMDTTLKRLEMKGYGKAKRGGRNVFQALNINV